jgi:hypothetical protein
MGGFKPPFPSCKSRVFPEIRELELQHAAQLTSVEDTMHKFHTVLAREVDNDRRKGILKKEISEDLGYQSTSSLDGLIAGTGEPSRETYTSICKRWPRMVGTLNPQELKPLATTGAARHMKKSVIEAAPKEPKTKATSKCAYVSIFEATSMLMRLKEKALVAEALENLLIHHKVPQLEVIGALKAGE